jgi:sugar phosphate isomerase/epimerase
MALHICDVRKKGRDAHPRTRHATIWRRTPPRSGNVNYVAVKDVEAN